MGFTCVFTQSVKHTDDPAQYRTGYDVKQVNRMEHFSSYPSFDPSLKSFKEIPKGCDSRDASRVLFNSCLP